MKLILLLCFMMSPACKRKIDDSVDSIPYFRVTSKSESLDTRSDACNRMDKHKFDSKMEHCLSSDEDKETCESRKFHKWNSGSKTCVLDKRILLEYNEQQCTTMGNVMQNGVCVNTTTP